MEETSESQYQTPEARSWRTGDLCRFPAGLVLCVGVGNLSAQFITADGLPLADVGIPGESTPGDATDAHVLHNTGLVYDYQGRAQLERDFAEGLFRPYFDIL